MIWDFVFLTFSGWIYEPTVIIIDYKHGIVFIYLAPIILQESLLVTGLKVWLFWQSVNNSLIMWLQLKYLCGQIVP